MDDESESDLIEIAQAIWKKTVPSRRSFAGNGSCQAIDANCGYLHNHRRCMQDGIAQTISQSNHHTIAAHSVHRSRAVCREVT